MTLFNLWLCLYWTNSYHPHIKCLHLSCRKCECTANVIFLVVSDLIQDHTFKLWQSNKSATFSLFVSKGLQCQPLENYRPRIFWWYQIWTLPAPPMSNHGKLAIHHCCILLIAGSSGFQCRTNLLEVIGCGSFGSVWFDLGLLSYVQTISAQHQSVFISFSIGSNDLE